MRRKVLVGILFICVVILLSTVIMQNGIANAEDIEYYVDYYGVMQPLRIATTEEPAYSGDHSYTADTLGTPDNPSRGTFLKALIWPPLGKTISSPIAKVRVVTYIECISGDYNSQSLEYRLYAYNIETGEIRKIHEDTWLPTGNTPTYFPLSYGLKTYDDTIICDTKKSALGEKETLILVSICHTFGAKFHHTKYAAHFDTKDYPAYMEVFTSDGKSTKYYIHDSFTTPSVASTGKIVYDSDESGNGDIWVMDADGSNKVRLTDDPERECLPRWSPNGKRIAYCKKDNDDTFDLWIMDSDGTNQRKIYDGDCTWGFYRISWLPDGSKVYFDPGYYAGGGGMPHKICWVDPDGPSTQLEHDLTPLAHPSWLYSEPDISRDGTKITFVHWEGHSWSYNNEIYIGDLSPEGDSVSNIVRLTTNSERDGHPSLAPDNSEIVWEYHSDIWIMNVDGSNPHSLTSDFSKEMAYIPSFSSNGQKIIFAASRNGYYDIWMMTIDGTELTQLTNTDDITECRPDFTSPTPTPIENHPPTVIRVEPTSDSITIEPGDTQEFKVKAEDVDEEEHNNLKMIEWFVDDVRMETGAADGKVAEVCFTHTFEDVGTFTIKATAYDEQMEEASVTWDVNVGVVLLLDANCVDIGDADNDGDNEIVIGKEKEIVILSYESGEWKEDRIYDIGDLWPVITISKISTLTIEDADNDGNNEIILGTSATGGMVGLTNYVITLSKNQEGMWVKEEIGTVAQNIAALEVGDANNDNKNEVIVIESGLREFVISYKKVGKKWIREDIDSSFIDWPLVWDDQIKDVCMGDVDADGENEVVIATTRYGIGEGNYFTGSGTVYVYSYDGEWNREQMISYIGKGTTAVTIGDGNNDGVKRIFVGLTNGEVITYESSNAEWIAEDIKGNISRSYISDILIEDYDSNALNEVLVTTKVFSSIWKTSPSYVLVYDYIDDEWCETKIAEVGKTINSAVVGNVKNIGNIIVVSTGIEPMLGALSNSYN